MPTSEFRGVYVTTTLTIVLITTIICGGLTETVLNITNMRCQNLGYDQDYQVITLNNSEMIITCRICSQRMPPSDLVTGTQTDLKKTVFQRFEKDVIIAFFGGPSQVLDLVISVYFYISQVVAYRVMNAPILVYRLPYRLCRWNWLR